jgi:hypothetical protein
MDHIPVGDAEMTDRIRIGDDFEFDPDDVITCADAGSTTAGALAALAFPDRPNRERDDRDARREAYLDQLRRRS